MGNIGLPISSTTSVTVSSAGTSVQVNSGTFQLARAVIFTADNGNGGEIFIGDSTVAETKYAKSLAADESITFGNPNLQPMIDLSSFWADTSNGGDIVHVHYF